MKTEYYTLVSKDDVKTALCGVHFQPDEGKPLGVLIIAHGMQEYVERYAPFAEYLCNKGIAVMGCDHIGHGGSVKDPSERGIMHSDHPALVLVEDLFTGYEYAKSIYPDIPCFVMGHSFGSYITRYFLAEKSSELSGLTGAIIMGTGTESPASFAAAKGLLTTLALIHGWDYKSTKTEKLMTAHIAGTKFDHTGTDPENSWLTKDPEIIRGYEADEKCNFQFSLNAFRALVEAAEQGTNKANAAKVNKSLPMLFVSGADDPVGQYGKGVKEAAKLYKRAGVEHVALRLYVGDRHEILNEIDKVQVYKDIYRWMRKGL